MLKVDCKILAGRIGKRPYPPSSVRYEWSGQRESNPHDQHGRLAGYHYIIPAPFLSFTASAGKFKTVSGLGKLWKEW